MLNLAFVDRRTLQGRVTGLDFTEYGLALIFPVAHANPTPYPFCHHDGGIRSLLLARK